MANIYHINGDSVSPCKATKGQCPYGQGSENNHFSDAGEAMQVLEQRLSHELGSFASVSKKDNSQVDPETIAALAEPKMAAELAAEGADAKEVRAALREENPSWGNRQVAVVASRMVAKHEKESKIVEPEATPEEQAQIDKTVNNLLNVRDRALAEQKRVMEESKALREKHRREDLTDGVREGRAYYYDYVNGKGKVYGVAPSHLTPSFDRTPQQQAEIKALSDKRAEALAAERDAQTTIEEMGAGHKIPDRGNTIRVNNQAQKWLLVNELQGQISDGKWSNSGPHDHWKDWSNADVIVDPKNPGRNFHARKDNYQLNATDLLDIVGDRMIDDVKENTGDDYNEKTMRKDLADLRSIFKTSRGNV